MDEYLIKPINTENSLDVIQDSNLIHINNNLKHDYSREKIAAFPKLLTQNHLKTNDKLPEFSMEFKFKKFRKSSSILLTELNEILERDVYIFKYPINIMHLDFDTLIDNVNNDNNDCKNTENLLKSNNIIVNVNSANAIIKKSDIHPENNKDKIAITNQNAFNSDAKLNAPAIQFILSSPKSCEYIYDKNMDLFKATFDWAIKKLGCSLKHIEISSKYEKEKLWIFKTELNHYEKSESILNTSSKDYDTFLPLIEFAKQSIDKIRNVLAITQVGNLKYKDVISNDGTRTIYYPSGRMAILYIQIDFHLLLLYEDDAKSQILAIFTDQCKGLVFGSPNQYTKIILDQYSCKLFNMNSTIEREMKWPNNMNNLQYSIKNKFNNMMSFYCSGKTNILVKFDGQDKRKPIIINIHDWFFNESKILLQKTLLLSNLSYTSNTALEIIKTNSSKSNKKDDNFLIKDNEIILISDLQNFKKKIRIIFENWINYYKTRIICENKPRLKRATKSAFINRDKINAQLSEYQPNQSLSFIRNMSASVNRSTRKNVLDNESPFGQRKNIKNLFLRPQTALENNDKQLSMASCPLKIQTRLLNKQNLEYSFELSDLDNCYCSKHNVTQVTDIELLEFLHSVKFNQVTVIGVISTKSSINEENSKAKFIENSLANLIKEIYLEDLKNSYQKPCVFYERKAYRLFLYDLNNSGKYLNSTQSLLLRQHQILPGMCLMFQQGKLMFADYIFNGYNSNKSDLFKQINLCRMWFENGFYLPNDFQLSFNNESKQWIEESAYSKIQSFNYLENTIR